VHIVGASEALGQSQITGSLSTAKESFRGREHWDIGNPRMVPIRNLELYLTRLALSGSAPPLFLLERGKSVGCVYSVRRSDWQKLYCLVSKPAQSMGIPCIIFSIDSDNYLA
jgi:hypothetical protein